MIGINRTLTARLELSTTAKDFRPQNHEQNKLSDDHLGFTFSHRKMELRLLTFWH